MKRLLCFALSLLLCLTLLPAVPAFAAGDVTINETNFPDKGLRSYISYYFDTDSNGKLSAAEIGAAKEIKPGPSSKSIENLKGIELLTALTLLDVPEANITSIDLSKSTNLEKLVVSFTPLTALDLSKNTKLTNLCCVGARLTALDLSKNTELNALICDGNEFTSLDLSRNTKLTVLSVGANGITKLNLSNQKDLSTLTVHDLQIKKLDLSANTKLSKLDVLNTSLPSLDITMCPTLVETVKNTHHDPALGSTSPYTEYQYGDSRVTVNKGFLLYVDPKATITAQPGNVSAEDGTTASFTVKAEGSTGWLEYQWQCRTSENGDWFNSSLSTAKEATLKIRATASVEGYQYRCKVSNSASVPVYTQPATLSVSVTKPPVISKQPKNVGATKGETASFTVKTPNSGVSYQWQCRTSSSGGWFNSGLSTAKTAALKVKATASVDGYQYRCKVTNAVGTTISDAVTLTVKPDITKQPQSVTAAAGETASFTVKATGATSYQWQCRTSAYGSWFNSSLASARTETLQIKATHSVDGYQYRCKVTNAGVSVYTEPATLTVNKGITAQPQSVFATAGETVSFTVKAEGALSYQWQYCTSAGGSWYNSSLSTARTETLILKATPSVHGYLYRCKITDAGGTVYSDVATLMLI